MSHNVNLYSEPTTYPSTALVASYKDKEGQISALVNLFGGCGVEIFFKAYFRICLSKCIGWWVFGLDDNDLQLKEVRRLCRPLSYKKNIFGWFYPGGTKEIVVHFLGAA